MSDSRSESAAFFLALMSSPDQVLPDRQTPEGEQALPRLMAELSPEEELVVLLVRGWMAAIGQPEPGACPRATWHNASQLCRAQMGNWEGRIALQQCHDFMRCVVHASKQPFGYNPIAAPHLCPEEAWVLTLIAACQNRQPRLARRLVTWRNCSEGGGAILAPAIALARSLARQGLFLSVRTRGNQENRERPSSWQGTRPVPPNPEG